MSKPKSEPSPVVRRKGYSVCVIEWGGECEARIRDDRGELIVSTWHVDRRTAIRMADAAMKVKLGRKA